MRLLHIEAADIHNRDVITLNRSEESGLKPITLTIHALSPTHAQDAEIEIPSPRPPKVGFVRNKRGMLDKDEMNRPIMEYDDDEPAYQAELREVQQLQAMKMIVDALDPGEVEFETKKGNTPPRQYYERIRDEMTKYGFSLGDYVTLIKAIARVSNLKEEDIAAARLDFFEGKESHRRTSSIGSSGRWAGHTETGPSSTSPSEPDGSPSTN